LLGGALADQASPANAQEPDRVRTVGALIGFANDADDEIRCHGVRSERKKAMAKAYKRLRRERTERRLKNQSFLEPSKRPLTGKRKKSFIRSLFSKDVSEPRRD
jgi:hypothetical protein